jgi:L-lactate dehydrogenase complex protein LldF
VQIDLPRMLAALRHKLAYGSDRWNTRQHNPAEAYAFTLWRLLVTRSFLYRPFLKIGRFFQRPFVNKNKMIRKMAGIGSGWTDGRDLPPLAKRTFTELWIEKYGKNRTAQPTLPEEEK